ncbi:hypothetical protein [Streptomyces sp. cmx-4-9]|uniref:hypothetical protein n=1 Tax=Streptomyces sp. cmx-4-9 TaxID=2790941 RepID=UPI00397EE47C
MNVSVAAVAQAWSVSAVLPCGAAAALFGWARWYFAGAAPPATPVAVAGGAVMIAATCAGYGLRVGGSGGFFGALLLSVGLLATVAAAEQATARPASATCVVTEVRTSVSASYGEGAPEAKTVHRFALRCPGGYPDELKDDRPVAAEGAEVRVAYDPGRRVSPALEGDTSPWKAALCAALLLAVSTWIARAATGPPAD